MYADMIEKQPNQVEIFYFDFSSELFLEKDFWGPRHNSKKPWDTLLQRTYQGDVESIEPIYLLLNGPANLLHHQT